MVWDNEWERNEIERQEAFRKKMALQEQTKFNKKINSGFSTGKTIDLSNKIVINPVKEQEKFVLKVLKWLKNKTTLILK